MPTQYQGWPRESTTDGFIADLCWRSDDLSIELMGLCWIDFGGSRGGGPIRSPKPHHSTGLIRRIAAGPLIGALSPLGTHTAVCDESSIGALVPAAANWFSDVQEGHQFFTQTGWMSDQRISTGFGDGTYRPTLPVSRQAMAAFLWRVVGEPAPPAA